MDRFTPSKDLRDRILRRIVADEQQRARKYVFISVFVAAGAIFGIVASIQYLAQTIQQSGFYQYLSLAFSDPDVVIPLWKEFAFSLAESAPLFGTTLVLMAVVVLLISLRTFMNNNGRHFGLSFSN